MIRHILLVLSLTLSGLSLTLAQSFTGTGGAIPDDGTTIVFDLQVSGLPTAMDTSQFGIERICINAVHQWVADLSIQLKAPDGTLIPLVSGVGGDTDGFVNTCFKGNADQSIFEVWYPFTGEFRPFGDMGQINNGQDPNGIWQLIILDTYAFADAGELLDWSISFGNDPAKPFPFESSDLPILKIFTGGQPIVNDPKIDAQCQVIDNGPGVRNYLNQTNYAYAGPIGIELRGNSSQGMPKKSFNFEVRDEEGEDKDVALLGLPEGSDFALSASFSDKTLMRNALAYETFRQLGHYATRTRYCELVLDNTYQGVYVLIEEIRRDKDRVDIARLRPEDTTDVDLTGGYMVRIDWNRTPGWNSQFNQPNSPNIYTYFQHTYPRWDELHPLQQTYIRTYIDSFEVALHGPQYQDPTTGWRKFADEPSFMDYLILNEISKNVDGYRLSTYFFKDKDDAAQGGKLKMGPPWDYDLAFYNADYCDGFTTDGFAFNINYVCGDAGVPFWWEKLMSDTLFTQNLACRWQSLRQTTLKNAHFFGIVDSMAQVVDEAQERNFLKWPILGKYVWPNPGVLPPTYTGEVNKMKAWINSRFVWLDATFGQNLPSIAAEFNATPTSTFDWLFDIPATPGYTYSWDFGDGTMANQASVVHTFPGVGTYQVKLTVQNAFGCSETTNQSITVMGVGAHESVLPDGFMVYPNPASELLYVIMPVDFARSCSVKLVNMLGEVLWSKESVEAGSAVHIPVKSLPQGPYMLDLQGVSQRVVTKVLIKL